MKKSIRKKSISDYEGTHYQIDHTGELILIPRYKTDKSFPKTVPIPTYIPKDKNLSIKSLRKQSKIS